MALCHGRERECQRSVLYIVWRYFGAEYFSRGVMIPKEWGIFRLANRV